MWLRLSAIKLCLGKPRSSNKVRIGKPWLDQNNVKVFSEFAFGTDLLATREPVEKTSNAPSFVWLLAELPLYFLGLSFLCSTLGWIVCLSFVWLLAELLVSLLTILVSFVWLLGELSVYFLCLTPCWAVAVFADHSCFLCLYFLFLTLGWVVWRKLWTSMSCLLSLDVPRPVQAPHLANSKGIWREKKHFLSGISWKGLRVVGH